jgi:formate dehydrogenase major subunit
MALWDLANADVITIMGSNMAENHPVAFRFVTEAQARGATVIHVDPRFTRTSAIANIHAPIRSGTDIAFLGGIIRYILENDLWFREFALAYTNIATIIEDAFQDPDQNQGVFSGFDPANAAYKMDTWQYKGQVLASPLAEHRPQLEAKDAESGEAAMTRGPAPHDNTLQNPNCVYQIMRRHFARYTPEIVEQITGCPKEIFLRVTDAIARNSGRERTGAFCYAVGWTHHSIGVQMIRAASIIQGLLGNIGRPGGGVMALRGHCSIQGSTDIPTLYNMLPTYLAQPNATMPHHSLKQYLEVETPATGWWHHLPKYLISLLKAWYGDTATKDNDFCYDLLPKLTGDHSQLPMTLAMMDGVVRGQFVLGQNPVVGGANSDLIERGLAKLEWLVVRDFAMTETADFWQKGRLVKRGELKPQQIGTEIFFLPSAVAAEKDGTVTNTSRLIQWHDKVCDPPGDSRSDTWFVYHLGRRLKALYANSTEAKDRPIQALTWDYPVSGPLVEPDVAAVLREINGWRVSDGQQLKSFEDIKDDGSTAVGAWLYTGIFQNQHDNKARSRKPDAPSGPGNHAGWAWAWPANRRTMYNRASADPDGKPWSERKKMIWWNADSEEWTGTDIPDFNRKTPPDQRPNYWLRPKGMEALSGADPFIMEADGKCHLFEPSGLKDGPLPTHYEPVESPVRNALHKQQINPAAKLWPRPGNEYHDPEDPRFPYVFTTFRLTELHCGGIPTRVMPHTAELQPEAFVEISPELASELGISNLDWTVLSTARGNVDAKALVTTRLRPFIINGKLVHQVGMPWVFGWDGYATGDIANVLLAIHGDPNTSIHTTKALTCNLRKGRL